jgi:hypothetical protein
MGTLRPYPYPDGVEIPRLMPFQEYPWNNDHHLAAEAIRLRDTYGLTCAVETGTCLGSTTLWLAENFDTVYSFELHRPSHAIAEARCSAHHNAHTILADSTTGLRNTELPTALYFLDAHWGDHCPLLDELDVIAQKGNKPCIIIHDFMVPGTTFGFDRMPDGTPFTIDLIRSRLDAIYPDGWQHRYPTEVAGAERGWVSISPQ